VAHAGERKEGGGWSSGLAHAGRKGRPGMERGERREGEKRWAVREEPAQELLLLFLFPFLYSNIPTNSFEFK
jgi:hypothetical protein